VPSDPLRPKSGRVRCPLAAGTARLLLVIAAVRWCGSPSRIRTGMQRNRYGVVEPVEASACLFYRPDQWRRCRSSGAATCIPLRARHRRQDRGDEDRSTPSSPLCRPGDEAVRQARRYRHRRSAAVHGRSADMVQAQNDFISAVTSLTRLARCSISRRSTTSVSARSMTARRSAQGSAERPRRARRRRERHAFRGGWARAVRTGCASRKSDQEITDSRKRARSIRRPRSTRRSPARSCNARSGRPICRQRRERSCFRHRRPVVGVGARLHPRDRGADGPYRPAVYFTCSPIRTFLSATYPMSPRRSIRPRVGFWCAQPSTMPPDCSSPRCSRA